MRRDFCAESRSSLGTWFSSKEEATFEKLLLYDEMIVPCFTPTVRYLFWDVLLTGNGSRVQSITVVNHFEDSFSSFETAAHCVE